jgi:hypothetical protein
VNETTMTREQKLEKFGPGPWIDEPDREEWRHEGFACLIVRGPLGNLCGYVGVPPAHPWHGKGCNDVDVSVHCGLTYADACQGDICHVAQPGEPDELFWFGFDCAHYLDVVPELVKLTPQLYEWATGPLGRSAVYRDLAYMRAEVEQLAEQAKQSVTL